MCKGSVVAYLSVKLAPARETKESHKTLSLNSQQPDWRKNYMLSRSGNKTDMQFELLVLILGNLAVRDCSFRISAARYYFPIIK